MSSDFDAALFRRSLLSWYRKHGRDLPWRHTRDPYAILVSEFMLQQTQVGAALPYFSRWMRLFPDFTALARASEQEALHAWQGLGYYARARNLRRTAQIIVEKHRGDFPTVPSAIRDLPGVGRYTANAILTFAYNERVPIVEANIARLLSRLFNVQTPIDTGSGQAILWQKAQELLPVRAAHIYNSALMDLGALICGSRPRCTVCPVREFCKADVPDRLPLRRARPPIILLRENHEFVVRHGRVLLEKSADRWRGMWMLPRLKKISGKQTPLHISHFPFTNHRITLNVFAQRPISRRSSRSHRWFSIDEVGSIPLPSPHRRALEILLSFKS